MEKPNRIVLEPLIAAHAEELFLVLCDLAIYAFISDRPPSSVSILAAHYHRLESRLSPDGSQQWLNWAIRHIAGRQCIGYVQATIYSKETADLAFVLGPAFWGMGLAWESSAAALSLLFTQYGITSVFATVDKHNLRSSALLLRLNFQQVAAVLYPHGDVDASDDVYRLDRNL